MSSDEIVDIVQSIALVTICATLIYAIRALIHVVNSAVATLRKSNQEILDRLEHVETLLNDDIAHTLSVAIRDASAGRAHDPEPPRRRDA